MRLISAKKIQLTAEILIAEANFSLPTEVKNALQNARKKETSTPSKMALKAICKNMSIAPKEHLPLCQDTGTAVFFVRLGHKIKLEEPLLETLTRATKAAYKNNFLRASIVEEPLFFRKNTEDNCPPIIHFEHCFGEEMEMIFLPKGGGAENKSTLTMLRPSDGEKGVLDMILETAKKAGGSSCPPWIIGVGIGGTFDTVAGLAKKALLRPLGDKNKNERYAIFEKKIKTEIQKLGIGAMGFGGRETVLAVHIKWAPTHIASLPVAVNIQCHSARRASCTL